MSNFWGHWVASTLRYPQNIQVILRFKRFRWITATWITSHLHSKFLPCMLGLETTKLIQKPQNQILVKPQQKETGMLPAAYQCLHISGFFIAFREEKMRKEKKHSLPLHQTRWFLALYSPWSVCCPLTNQKGPWKKELQPWLTQIKKLDRVM